ncbi:MAG TPA: carnitine dehydratase [Cytophagales bacterium]|nr:carnitine dehydratase [Cytophagales bacterium]
MNGEGPIFEGLRVLELATVLAGPSVGQFFAELGAEVIKVENPNTGGDVTRSWQGAGDDPANDRPAYFTAINWGKQSLAIDLRSAEGQSQVHELVRETDVVIASYKPGDAEKLRVDYATLQGMNPRLLYGHITSYGPDNPRAGFDAIIQAESGFTYMNGHPDGEPTKMPVALTDVLAAHHLKEGLLVALIRRERTGRGSYVPVSLIQAAISSLANQGTNWLVAGKVPQRKGNDHPNIVPYGTLFTTQDGRYLTLAVGNDAQFRKLATILEQSAWADDERFATNAQRVIHRELLLPQIQEAIASWDRDTLLAQLAKERVPAGSVNTLPEVFSLPEAQEILLKNEAGTMTGVRNYVAGLEVESLNAPPSLPRNPGSME